MGTGDPAHGEEARFTRRSAIGGALAMAGIGAMEGPAWAADKPPRAGKPPRTAPAAKGPATAGAAGPWKHAIGDPRGSDIAVKVGREKEGRFGLMFKRLDAFSPPDELLSELAATMAEPADGAFENPDMPAGFTYLGQFIDHDMTLDRTPLSEQAVDPRGLRNFDTPRFDLASVYGRGPSGDPALYDPATPAKLRLERPNGFDDLPRGSGGVAMLGDARNDENLIVCQLHVAFMQFHNRLVAEGRSFADAQRLTRWHFQWLIVNDFLPRLAGHDRVGRFLVRRGNGRLDVKRDNYKPTNPKRPMIPIEYSVAAYRFGHSMVRPSYVMNEENEHSPAPIFADPPGDHDLHGARPIPSQHRVEWQYFFMMPGHEQNLCNRARLIDTRLAAGLFHLPSPQIVPAKPVPVIVSLAERNLLRGKRLGLPAGQDVAAAMGVPALSNRELGLTDRRWGDKAPLWFYILAESERHERGERLGEVGGRIVAETILTLIDIDRDSYFRAGFTPAPPIAPTKGQLQMADILTFATGG